MAGTSFAQTVGTNATFQLAMLNDATGNWLFCYGTTTPDAGTAGYARGCIFINTTASASIKVNDGTATASVWRTVTLT